MQENEHNKHKSKHKYKRIYIECDPDMQEIIVNQLSGKLGKRPPDVIKNIIRIYLTERGYCR